MARVGKWLVQVAPGEPGKGEGEGKIPERGPVYRNYAAKNAWVEAPEGVTTLYHSFKKSVDAYGGSPCLGWRPTVNGEPGPYKWMTYKQAYDTALNFASGLRDLGVEPQGRVGVYSVNCPQWMLTIQACNMQSLHCIPLYDSLGVDAVSFIVDHADVTIAIVNANGPLAKFAEALEKTPKVKAIITIGEASSALKNQVAQQNVKMFTFEEVVEKGKEKPVELSLPKPDDLCTIMYTSGTTGEPKGVMLTHKAVLYTIAGVEKFLHQNNFDVSTDDVFISYLPLAHVFDRDAEEFFLSRGAAIGYFCGDTRKLTADIKELRPTFLAGVPRVFERVYSGVLDKLGANVSKKRLFDVAYKYKRFWLNRGFTHNWASPMFDKLVFSKVKDALGGRCRLVISGGAPLSFHVEEFLRVTMCCVVLQGYGLTETCAASLIMPPTPDMAGTVGVPLPITEFRLDAVGEMNYSPTDNPPRGELCLRGPSLYSGYYKRDDLTKDATDADGWFHTGDIGELTRSGGLKIIDRKKNIFKLSQGEYVAVEHLENLFGQCPLFEQIWLYGNSFETSLVCVAVPKEDKIMAWAKENGVNGSLEEVCKSDATRKYALEQLTAAGKAARMKGFEFPKAVYLDSQPFDEARDLVTPTMKKKRPQLQKFYQKEIDEMYKSMK
eukprot:jgi/Chlat1/1672/Chrsp127S01906